jgi:hypothetical protein
MAPGTRLGLLCLAVWLVLAGCAPAATAASPTEALPPTAAPTVPAPPVPTATIVWFPPTPTPTRLPTLAVEPTPEQRPNLGEVLLEHELDPEGDPARQTVHTPSGSIAYGIHELTIAMAGGKGALASLRGQPVLSNFYLEITAAPSLCRGQDNYGLLLRASDAPEFYRFVLTCDGRMRLERLVNGQPAVIQDWTPRLGRPEASRLAVWVSEAHLRFFINDIFQFAVRDPALASGQIGVFARTTGEDALTVNFSDLVIRKIDPSGSIQPSPSPNPPTQTSAPGSPVP